MISSLARGARVRSLYPTRCRTRHASGGETPPSSPPSRSPARCRCRRGKRSGMLEPVRRTCGHGDTPLLHALCYGCAARGPMTSPTAYSPARPAGWPFSRPWDDRLEVLLTLMRPRARRPSRPASRLRPSRSVAALTPGMQYIRHSGRDLASSDAALEQFPMPAAYPSSNRAIFGSDHLLADRRHAAWRAIGTTESADLAVEARTVRTTPR